MSSDYQKIRQQNIKEYGEGTRHLAFLGQLYTERTHFIFELLQNAEDAQAKKVCFNLYRDRLELWHDGRPFNEKDVRGICGIAESTKTDDINKIGKFGIGFKSVYAYTSSPEIYSSDEHFAIEHYVRPKPIAKQRIPSPWTTIFKFPFNHIEISAQKAFAEIKKRLETLRAHTLLFLRSVHEIQWNLEDKVGGTYYSNNSAHSTYRWIRVIGERGKQGRFEEEWLVLERPVKRFESHQSVKVEVAFKVVKDEKTNQKKIVRINPSQLVVFFPTEKETRLGFLIQGPYRTTPARDNIPQDDPWNQRLIRETARLVCDGLFILRKIGLLTVSALQTMPLRETDFPAFGMFRPFYDEVRKTLTKEALLPTDDDSFSTAKYAKLGRLTEFRALLGQKQLQLLYQDASGYRIRWLSSAITHQRTGDLWAYLQKVLNVEEVTPTHFVEHLSLPFIEQQSDEWLISFYRFLVKQSSLWKLDSSFRPPLLRRKPFIRLENGLHVIPFKKNKVPNAYLPSQQETSFPIVKHKIANDEQALAFLQALGLQEPKKVDELIKFILPKYKTVRQTGLEHTQNIHKIVSTLNSDLTKKQRNLLISELRKTRFLIADNIDKSKRDWQQSKDIYIRTKELEAYFKNNVSVWFLAEDYEQRLIQPFSEIRIRSSVHMTRRKADTKGYVTIKHSTGSHKRGLNGFDPDIEIDGLAHAVTHPTSGAALYIWNHILPKANCIRGIVESSTRQTYSSDHTTRSETISKIGELLMQNAWLPDQTGTFHKPAELSLDDLPPEFDKNEALAKELEMKSTSLATIANEVGIELEHIEFLKSQPPEFQRIFSAWKAKQVKQAKKKEQEEQLLAERFNYRDELKARFDRTPVSEIEDDILIRPRTAVSRPARRRKKIAQEIKEQQQEEPTRAERFIKVPSKRWESKKNETRIFLEEEYRGKCQICDSTFPKRDGNPYFEGLYLVSYTQARWVDRPGNILCLCATCCAKFQYGSVETEENILTQVEKWKAYREGGSQIQTLKIKLCAQDTIIYFTERHMIDLQQLLTTSSRASSS